MPRLPTSQIEAAPQPSPLSRLDVPGSAPSQGHVCAPADPKGQRKVILAAMLTALGLWILATPEAGARVALAVPLGALAGISLYHARFGFTAAWRRFAEEHRGRGLRAQLLLLGLSSLVALPLIGWGHLIGLPTSGYVFPFGLAAALGATLFGIGMQLGGGCASGTLFTVGGGSTRMVVTLIAFIAGSVWATAHLPWWNGLPALPPVAFAQALGTPQAMLATTAALSGLALLSVWVERRAHGALEREVTPHSLLRGPWSFEAGAVALAFVGIATLLVLGRPWGITSAFALWGAKTLAAFGVPVETWPYWQGQTALSRNLLQDGTSLMNFGIILGALLASGLAGKFAPVRHLHPKDALSAVIGGLLMGYGARLAYGCNIGAYLGGVLSGSLHGWLWLVFAWAGSLIGMRLRPVFAP
ncbi:YeeE/YedE family protein [Roseibium aestuarii]|uniref:YeeE/YedE family protein n=1 Tax=Roseibium aestuarii TaxID=2600299 RepID=A0ABW4JZ41_9HYPH|nr:YeeE/YedE family protein [Roseibium aestuarii]